MTHICPSTPRALAGMLSTPHLARERPTSSPRLDLARLHSGVAARRAQLASLETEMVAACEQSAARGRPGSVRMDDRETWDRSTWDRYLAAATRLEPDYGPAMRRLLQEIDQLTRLMALPLVA